MRARSFRLHPSALLLLLPAVAYAAPPEPRIVELNKEGKLEYDVDAKGNRVPDFSYAGYKGGGVPLPEVPAKVMVQPAPGDDSLRIQRALMYVSSLPADSNGWRGAVQLAPGQYEVEAQLTLAASGVVLRGAGSGRTTILATGQSRRTLIEVLGRGARTLGTAHQVASEYVPVNATTLELDSTEGLQVGDSVLVERPSPKNWIEATGQGEIPGRDAVGWKAGTLNTIWDRRITAIDGNKMTVDVPLTCALEKQFGGGKVTPYQWPERIQQVGIEGIRLESTYDKNNLKDEDHSWMAITLDKVEDAWVRDVIGVHFVSSIVNILEGGRRITVQDCHSRAPIAEMGGYRRHSFYTAGGQTLFLHCTADEGRHDFTTGWMAPGPNAFVYCEATNAHGFSGPIESWATGVLLDNVKMDGAGLRFDNRELWDNAVGWAAGNSLMYQCWAPTIIARTPPTAQNWVIGSWAQFAGDAKWRSPNEFVNPDSIYEEQLKERSGADAAKAVFDTKWTVPAATGAAPIATVLTQHPALSVPLPPVAKHPVDIKNGWITVDGRLLIGSDRGVDWWRGSTNPQRNSDFGDGITRFAPGRTGQGETDDLDQLATKMSLNGTAAIRHHWGLWYDRRRDDHEMVAREDGDVWPPFFEQPWGRSGQGRASNGLSKYDLTKFNPWYFGRLEQFASLCDQKGMLYINNMYFQHNILEAGAHWAEFPWRTLNNVNTPGFPEPPPYAGGKRIFMAEMFYDTTNKVRVPLHRLYIRHSLDNLAGNTNVLHLIGEEYMGPLHFTQFWVDEVAKWRKDTKKKVLIGLSTPKDVQDAILADPKRAAQIDAIDFNYWWVTTKGPFTPKGGQNMSPRQEERLTKVGRPDDVDLARMAAEYRGRFPQKAIINGIAPGGWAFLCAGGSMPRLPRTTDTGLLAAIPAMRPFATGTNKDQWTLAEAGKGYLVYATGPAVKLDLTSETGTFMVQRIDARSGGVLPADKIEAVKGGAEVTIPTNNNVIWLVKH